MYTFYEDCPFHVGGSAEASFVFPPISFQLRDTFGAQVQVKVEFLIWVSLQTVGIYIILTIPFH